MMRFMSSFKVFSMSSSMDWSGGITVGDLIVRIKKRKKKGHLAERSGTNRNHAVIFRK